MSFCLYSTRFTRFGVGLGNTANCDTVAPQKKHEKTLDFYTDYLLFCILDVFLICLFVYFSTVKRVNYIENDTTFEQKSGVLSCFPCADYASVITVILHHA